MAIRGVVDLGNKSADQLEREASGLEPGWFRASVADVYEDKTNLKIKLSLADGRQHIETLWDPQGSEDDKAAKRLQQRRDAFAVRLGLVPREAKGTAYEFDWCDCIGRDCVLHLVMGKPKDGKQYVQLDWMGLFDISDPRVPEVLRGSNPKAISAPNGAAGGAGTSASASATTTATAPTRSALNLDDL